MTKHVSFLVLSLSLLIGQRAAAFTVTERVNCAGALSKSSRAFEDSKFYPSIGLRSVTVSITSRQAYEKPRVDNYIELPMSDDRLPLLASRIKPLLRRWWQRNDVVQLTLAPNEDLDSAKIQAFATQLEERGYTRESLAQRPFDVRLGSLQFTGEEFWTALKGAADRGNFVSVNAERGFLAQPGRFTAVTIPQTLTWLTKGLVLGSVANVVAYQIDPTNQLIDPLLQAAGAMVWVSQIGWLADDLPPGLFASPIAARIRRLLLFLPDFRGFLNTARHASVMEQRTKVVINNMAEALAKYPDLSTVQIVTESKADVERVRRAVDAHFAEVNRIELEKEEATWTEDDPSFARFPGLLRYKMPDLKHRPTRELIEQLKVTFGPRQFGSADEFIAYYRPENLANWPAGKHDWTFQQYVAMYLFDSLRWSLPQFFKLDPTPAQVRTLLNLAHDHFDRGQLHEYPVGESSLGTFALIAVGAHEWFKDDEGKLREAFAGVQPLPAAEWRQLTTHLGQSDHIASWAASYAKGYRPRPASFAAIPANQPDLMPDITVKYNFPADGW